MSRIVRSALAIAVGFLGATAVFSVVDRDQDSEPEVVGSVDVFDYCRARYGDSASAVLTVSDAYGWRCATRPNGIFQLLDVNFVDACEVLFDEEARPELTDDTDPYAWRCTTTE